MADKAAAEQGASVGTPPGMVRLIAPNAGGCGWEGVHYSPDERGVIVVPAAAAETLRQSHGFLPFGSAYPVEVDPRDQEIARLNLMLTAAASDITSRDAAIVERDAELAKRAAQLADARSEIVRLQAEVLALKPPTQNLKEATATASRPAAASAPAAAARPAAAP
jgi:hypothetical protein